MHRLHEEFLAELKKKAKADNDEVCLFSLSFMELMEDHELFQRGVRRGDFVVTEALLLSWLPNWQAAAGKHKYVDLTLNSILAHYGGSIAHLDEMRLNKYIRISEEKGFFPLDEVCELLNLLVKHLPASKDMDTL